MFEDLVHRSGLYFKKFTNVPFSGKVVGQDINKLQIRGELRNGKWNGEWEKYFSDGNLMEEGDYKEGRRHGIWKVYHSNGGLSFLSNYKDGNLDGYSEGYDKNGLLVSKSFWKDGEETVIKQGLHNTSKPSNNSTVEIEYWKSISNSSDSATYRAYLDTYPDGLFTDVAMARIASLTREQSGIAGLFNQSESNPKNRQQKGKIIAKYIPPSLPDGFLPKYSDRQAYTSQKIQRFIQNPGYFEDKPDKIAEVFAYLEYMIAEITRPNNHQISAEQKQRYFEIRNNLRAAIGLDLGISTTAAIAVLYSVSKMDPETFKAGLETDDISAMLQKQGFDTPVFLELFKQAGVDLGGFKSVGDTFNDLVAEVGLDQSVADTINDALGFAADISFADFVAEFNAAFGTSYSEGTFREAIGLDTVNEVGNTN